MMLNSYKRKKEDLEKEIEDSEHIIKNIKNAIEELKINNSKLEIEKNNMEKEIKELEKKKQELDIEIKNRREYFIERELIVIDSLTGIEFENYFANILSKLGYKVNVTKASNDDGGDIIAEEENVKYIFQCKNYSNAVGNKAIQEVYTAKDIYKCDKAIVITNNYFTSQAKNEANILSVSLWNRDILKTLLYKAFDFDTNNIDEIYNNLFYNKYSNQEYKNNYSKKELEQEQAEDDDIDPFLVEAIEAVIEQGQASTSFIQRKFKVGYARAERILDKMEELGVISGYQGIKPREVLINDFSKVKELLNK